ncbi:trypsin-like serine protease [Segniliparus rugosus]|uniref:Peptidase S1 family protein n=1 Tax=Segniliparus rugosus (strain ATCC BAA-974 / DSM 45345 / CCUG 50838 / CIP 108380 / JCM 13579 / CDC 945) TaxID=679197 RepID=E5XS48_SEGRC|nr:trypsin-like serine protease [Segniliparus rugosus]EFV12833.1 hypothetical protein HMPREF9336_02320 [Segniliparus rugosus ATCC BAA-974]
MLKRSIGVLAAALASALCAVSTAAVATADDRVPLGAGSPIIVVGQEKLACTLTAIGHDVNDDIVGLTAGHCGDVGDSVVSEVDQDAGSLGRLEKKRSNPDIGVIKFNPSRVIPTARTGKLVITGLSRDLPRPGTMACKLGRTTGWTCGQMTPTNRMSHTAKICIAKGDSGAPVVIGSTLVGMVNVYYFDTPCAGPEGGTNIGAVLDAIGPGVGEGFELQPA